MLQQRFSMPCLSAVTAPACQWLLPTVLTGVRTTCIRMWMQGHGQPPTGRVRSAKEQPTAKEKLELVGSHFFIHPSNGTSLRSVSQSHRSPQWDWVPVVPSNNLLLEETRIGFPPFPVSLPYSPTGDSWGHQLTPSKLYPLQSCFKICTWGNLAVQQERKMNCPSLYIYKMKSNIIIEWTEICRITKATLYQLYKRHIHKNNIYFYKCIFII